MLALDERRPQTQLAGSNRRHVAARSTADDDDVVRLLAHPQPAPT
jgi:hypothetical protein